MKKIIIWPIILILSIFLSGCNPPPENPLLGSSTIQGNVYYFDKPENQSNNIKVNLIPQTEDSPLNINNTYVVTGNSGSYKFQNIPAGTYLILAQDIDKNYQPANVIVEVADNQTITAETMILTKVIKHIVIFRETETGWSNAGIPSSVIGDILTTEIGMTEGTSQNQFEYRSIRDQNPNLNLNIGDLIIIEGDQPQDFYDFYTNNIETFNNFIANGGTIFWIACDNGWAYGNYTSHLPGGVTWRDAYDSYNNLVYFEHPITKNFPEQLYGNYASHGGFDNLDTANIANLMIYIKEKTGDGVNTFPTYIEYRYNKGRVLATTAPLEWYVTNGPTEIPEGFNTTYKDLFKLMLVRSLRYIMNLNVSPDIPISETINVQILKVNGVSHK
uniref:Carboxypeptidase regulatory-like domain-containing protein n=1 Tax=Dictyoglomus thermophilum TaxID=14 RepID=A0A7C3MIH5_DICTH